MRRTGPRAHYVGHNKVTRIPRGHVYLDSEAVRAETVRGEVQTFRLAVTAYDRRTHGGDGWRAREWSDHGDIGSVWDWVLDRCQRRARTVLVAHNLAYDLRLCDAFGQLPARGWQLRAVRLADRQAWCSWRCDGRTLVMVDSLSWFALPLERVGELVGIAKLALPDWDDTDTAWFARCRRDVEILAEAWRRVLAWCDDADLGNWKPTGAGQAWAAYRHRFMTHHLFVHEDTDARAAEREAAYTGRCEAWQHGKLAGGPFTEWDYTNAYATIGAECDVPTKLLGEIARPTLDGIVRARAKGAVLVEATVTSSVPTLPVRTDDGIVWPVGTFTGTWWDNELVPAVIGPKTVTVHRAWWYRKAPALEAFCRWVLEQLAPDRTDVDPIVRVILKHWGRALIGRTAAQWSRWEAWGRSPVTDVALGKVLEAGTGEQYEMLQLGHQLIRSTDVGENPDAMVSIMSWVMAEARVRLYRTMVAAGLEHVAYVDTDSLFVSPAGDARLRAAAIPGLRVKSQWRSVEIYGPRQLVLAGDLRAAGIPRGSVRVAPATWEGDVWSGLPTSLRVGERDRVRIMRRLFRLRGTDRRRQHLPDGRTAAVELGRAGDISLGA